MKGGALIGVVALAAIAGAVTAGAQEPSPTPEESPTPVIRRVPADRQPAEDGATPEATERWRPTDGQRIGTKTGRDAGNGDEGKKPKTKVKATPTPNLLEQTPRGGGTPVPLGVDAAHEDAIRMGQALILNREYDEGIAYFEEFKKQHPDSGLGPLGIALVYQAQMLENGDFAQEKEFDKAAKSAEKKLEDALEDPGMDVWDRMMSGGFYGVRGMHSMRKKKYFSAVNDGWEALSLMKWIKKKEPDLADTDLGLGAYDYYRSAMTRSVSWLPFFPDKRKQGVKAMERALVDAQYVRPIVQLVLVYTYIDERRYDDAITLGEDLVAKYPKNTLIRVQLGRAWSRKGKYSKAVEVFREVEELQPDNKVVGYYIGSNLMYEGKDLDTAETYLRAFIADPAGTEWRGWAYERLGDLYQKRGKPEIAIVYWKKAERDNSDDESVKKKIERAKKKGVKPTEVLPEPTPGAGPGTLP